MWFEFQEPGSGRLGPEACIQDPGSRTLDPGFWILEPGSRHEIQDPGFDITHILFESKIQAFRSQIRHLTIFRSMRTVDALFEKQPSHRKRNWSKLLATGTSTYTDELMKLVESIKFIFRVHHCAQADVVSSAFTVGACYCPNYGIGLSCCALLSLCGGLTL